MKTTNASAKLSIAKSPLEPNDMDRQYLEIKFLTNLIFNQSVNKQESKYYKNFGTTTQTITGQSYSISAAIDIEEGNEGHDYLIDMVRNRDISKMNNQYVKIFEPLFDGDITAGYSFGKCVIEFKNNFPSGVVDELVKLEFDIFPQDDIWEFVPPVKVREATEELEVSKEKGK